MTDEEVIKEIENIRKFNYTLAPDEVFDRAIAAIKEHGVLEQIRWERDVAIQQLKDLGYGLGEKPKENKGKWIELPKAFNPSENPCECSNCKHILSFMNGYPKSNFCPNCGADMRGES